MPTLTWDDMRAIRDRPDRADQLVEGGILHDEAGDAHVDEFHDVLVDGQELASPHLRPGEVTEWQIQIDRPGRYEVWCNEYVHLEKGMAAELVVE